MRKKLDYVLSRIDQNGIAIGYEADGVIKATARLGLIVAYVHLVLADDESLRILNKIANALSKLSDNMEDKIEDEYELTLVKQALMDFSVIHYGLTGSENSRRLLIESCTYFVNKFGWNPITSCPTYLLYSAQVAYLAGGKIDRNDIVASLDEIKDRYMDLVNYSAWGGLNLAYSLEMLSQGLKFASLFKIEPPVEIVALWEVHLNHSLRYVEEFNQEIDLEELQVFLKSFVSALEVPYNTKLRSETINISEELATKLLDSWISGGRIILQSENSLNYLIYDPSLNYSTLAMLYNRFPRIKVYDLDLPIILERLSKLNVVENLDKFKEASNSAVVLVSSSEPYFKVIEEDVMPKQDIVDNIISARFLVTWYALQKLKSVPSELAIVSTGFSYITLVSCSTILLILLIMYRMGKVLGEEE